ncbi:hypothetical protein Tco_1424498 [Tanacetum coccineum]
MMILKKEHPDVEKCMKRFNPYARYGVEHWKNSHAKIFYIRNQQAPGKPKEEIYSNSKIVQIIKTYWELGHEHKFITEIVARRANGSIVSIAKSDYKNLNKNDIEDMYLLIVNHKVWKAINNKSTLLHQQSFSQALRSTRVLEGLKSYNNNVKYGYVTHNLSKEDVEYLQLFAEEIEEQLKYQDQMRIWEMSSEDASTNDDDDGEDDDLLVDEENEIVEHDVDVHMFGITKDLPFNNIGITSLVLGDVLEGEDVNVVNGAKEAKDRFYMHFIESKRNLKLFKNDKTSVRARCRRKMSVFTMSQCSGPTGLKQVVFVRPSGSSGPCIRSRKRKTIGTNDDSIASSYAIDAHDKGDIYI